MKNVIKKMSEQELCAWWKSEKSKTIVEIQQDIQALEDAMSSDVITFTLSDPNPMARHLMAIINACSNPKTKDTWGLRVGLDTASQVLNIPLDEIEAEIIRRRTSMIKI